MPIYEYRCRQCSEITTHLILSSDDARSLRCGACGGRRLARVPSRFACHKTEAQRVRELDRGALRSESFLRDRRNIGLWAKRRAADLGADLGDRFEEGLERARTARRVEDLAESVDASSGERSS